MRWLGWIAIAAFAGLALGCANDNALYTSPKYVRGYTPSGSTPSKALAYAREHERKPNTEWRER